MFRRFIGKVYSNKVPITTMGISFASIFVCYRYQKTRNDFIKRNLFERIFDRDQPMDAWISIKYLKEYLIEINPWMRG
jgi:hypothetical protein